MEINKDITRGLFLEGGGNSLANVRYTLERSDKEHKGVTYPSLYRLYMEMEDTTEFEFANAYLADYEHWLKITSMEFFQEHIDLWRRELALKLENRFLDKIKQIAADDGKEALNAAKYLLDRAQKLAESTSKNPKGRPLKALKFKQEDEARGLQQQARDFDRIFQEIKPKKHHERNNTN